MDGIEEVTLPDTVSRKAVKRRKLVAEYRRWIKLGEENMQDVWDECDLCDKLVESKHEKGKIKIRFTKRVVNIAAEKIYPRNPSCLAKAKRPILAPMPEIDPATGMPAVDPATGDFAPPPDISEERAEVVGQVMDHELSEISLEDEAKAAIHDALVRPGAVMEAGYEYDEWREVDDVFVRRRSLKDVIIDPYATISFGRLQDCRFVAVRHKLTEEDCKKRGLDPSKLPASCVERETSGVGSSGQSIDRQADQSSLASDEASKRYLVWRLWDSTRRLVAYLPVGSIPDDFPLKATPWPWKLDTFPIGVLTFDRIPDRQFGHSAVYDLQEQQQEMNDTRTTINHNVVNSRKRTIYDADLIPPEKVQRVADGVRNSWTGVKGLATMPEGAIREISPEQDVSGQREVYELAKGEIAEIGGVSDQDRLQGQDLTATEAEIINEAGKMATGARSYTANRFLRGMIKTLVKIVEQTYTTERVAKITGPDKAKYWIAWTGPELLQDFDLDIDIGSAQRMDSDTERLISQKLLESMKGVPGIDLTELGIDVIKANGRKNPERYRLPPAPAIPMGPDGMPLSPGGPPIMPPGPPVPGKKVP